MESARRLNFHYYSYCLFAHGAKRRQGEAGGDAVGVVEVVAGRHPTHTHLLQAHRAAAPMLGHLLLVGGGGMRRGVRRGGDGRKDRSAMGKLMNVT